MCERYDLVLGFVQQLAPTWRKTQVVNLALLVAALLERPCLCPTELARAYPGAERPLHGRLKRLGRFLANPRLDELAPAARLVKLAYRLADEPPGQPAERPLLPVLVDTTYFHPFAALVASAPCGGRALPLVWATYHRQTLEACLPPREAWPERGRPLGGPPRRGEAPTAARASRYLSQNHIEEALIDLAWRLLSTAIRAVLVADRGFARASLLARLNRQRRDYVVRIDAGTHVWLAGETSSRPAAEALAARPGERRWAEGAAYHKEERVPVNLLAVWDEGQEEPWFLATSLARADWAETMYRWRMRIECGNRDEKTGVLLREGGDDHRLTSALHLHRLLLGVAVAHWLCALAGLQAHAELPEAGLGAPSAGPPALVPPGGGRGPAQPPPPIPHRGPQPPLPGWMRRFAVRGHLSYVRLGLEVLRAPDLGHILRDLVRWLADHFRCWLPRWRPRQLRYRRSHSYLAPP